MTNETWALFCEIAFWGWISSAAVFVFHSFPARGIFKRRTAKVWGAIFLLSYAFWVFAMVSY